MTAWLRNRPRLLPWLLFALACPRTPTATTPSLPAEMATHEARVAGVELHVLPRETEGLVELRLYVDAGTLDAVRPSAAVVAAWALETEGLSVVASPRHLEMRMRTAVNRIERAVEVLGAALARRTLSPERHAALVARWREEGRHAHAQPERRADTLALVGLLGDGADPFGGDAPTRGEVEAFMETHLGTNRALLVVVGDVQPARVERAVSQGFGSAPRATASRGPVEGGRGGLSLDRLGESLHATVALEAGSRDTALGLARRALRSEIAESVAIYPHAEGVALLLRTTTLPRLRKATWLARHGAPARTLAGGVGAVVDEAEDEALRWRSGQLAQRGLLAVGVVCPHRANNCEARATEAARVGWLELGRHVEADGASATYTNGAQVRFAARRSREVAFALRFESGGAAHGEVVVLAHALARRCGVQARLDATGFSLVGGGHAWREQLRATVDCVTAGVTSTARDRLRLIDRLRARPERDWIAAALAPGMTSRVTPEGGLHEVAAASSERTRARLRELRAGRRVVLAIAGPVSADVAIGAAPMIGSWPTGESVTEARWGAPVALVPRQWDGPGVRVVFGWRHDLGHDAASMAARAFARAVGERLGAYGRVLWHDGDGGPWGSWAAVAVDMRPEDAEAVPAIARAVTAELDVPWEALAAEERWRGGDSREAAWRLARFGRPDSPPTGSELDRVWAGLARSEPVFAVGRGQNANVRRRLQRN